MTYKTFWLELRQRLKRDNSELLLGEATVYVPDLKFRYLEKELAIAQAVKLLSREDVAMTGCNQIMIYTARGGWFVDRVETAKFEDEECFRVSLNLKLADAIAAKHQRHHKGFGKQPGPLPEPAIELLKIPKAG